ncbi:MAG: hypothetical protein JWQ40_4426 [Segetibacter sp.]|jgi:hypothetical protein|nr:hypothetical protein [Segetibacter sp.]
MFGPPKFSTIYTEFYVKLKIRTTFKKNELMKYLLLLTGLAAIILPGCEKEQNRQLLNGYFKYTVKGAESRIIDGFGLNNNTFECYFRGDTALYVSVSKVYEMAGFFIKSDSIKDGTYILDNNNRAYYADPKDRRRYTTNNSFKGTVTIKKSTFQAKTILPTLEGQFSFNAVDTATGKSLSITNGSFLMERRD